MVKSPNNKRKSLGGGEGGPQTPKKTKLNEPFNKNKTPGKNANTPAKGPKQTPGKNAKQNGINKSPQQTPGKNPKQNGANKTPAKGPQNNQKTKPADTPAEKVPMFAGTAELQQDEAAPPKIETVKANPTPNKPKTPKGKKENTVKAAKDANLDEKKKKGQFFHLQEKLNSGDKDAIIKLNERIEEFKKRSELTGTAKRKLKLLEKLKRIAENGGTLPEAPKKEQGEAKTTSEKRRERKLREKLKREASGDKDGKVAPKQAQKKQAPKQQAKKTIAPINAPPAEDASDSESDYEVETVIKPDKIIQTKVKTDEDSAEESDEAEVEAESDEAEAESDAESDAEEESGDEEPAAPAPQPKKQLKEAQPKQQAAPPLKDLKDNAIVNKGQSRYVVFVGNLPYDATKQEITEHFQKVGTITSVRIPTDQQTNKPRGFAYVEVQTEDAYQRALSLHHSSLKGRRINVLYTEGGKKKGDERKGHVKAKNFKLQAMRQQGQLAGSVKDSQKRGARRAKGAQVNGDA